jgi:hypothetical protein
MDLGAHEVDYLAQAHWHHFRFRIGEMTALDRERREVRVAPYLDDEGREVTPDRVFGYDTLVLALGSLSNDFGTPGVGEHALKLESKPTQSVSTPAWSTPAFARTPRRRPCGPSSCTWRSSVPAPPASNWRPSCTERRVKWWPMGSIVSTPRRTSRST